MITEVINVTSNLAYNNIDSTYTSDSNGTDNIDTFTPEIGRQILINL